MSYTYTSFQLALASEMVVPNNNYQDANFQIILPTIIDYAEGRCYRDLDLLHTETEQAFTMVPYARAQSIATANPRIIIVERVFVAPPGWVAPPPGVLATVGGEPLLPSTVDYIDAVYAGIYPNPGIVGRPVRYAMRDDLTLILGPTPDQAYSLQITGKSRPTPLYSAAPGDGTQVTFLTNVLPELFLACAMISAAGYRKNYGAQADEPRMAVSWEQQYQELLPSAKNEEMRRRFLGWSGMSAYASPPMAAPAPAPAG
jgi:hypothetical protein